MRVCLKVALVEFAAEVMRLLKNVSRQQRVSGLGGCFQAFDRLGESALRSNALSHCDSPSWIAIHIPGYAAAQQNEDVICEKIATSGRVVSHDTHRFTKHFVRYFGTQAMVLGSR